MYRRLFLIGVLPLLGEGTARASIGCFAAIVMAVVARENAPFIRSTTNTLLVVAQYQIVAVFYAAFVLLAGSLADFGLSDLALGLLLLFVNCVVFALVVFWCAQKHFDERQALRRKEEALPRLEWAVEFSATKFATTFGLIREEQISGAHVLCFHYLSSAAPEQVSEWASE